ncbi:patched family-domain-containing protein [Gongronella butleri]|nr:patched family-domain-containing protein [Gongronella butleri]
MLFLLVFALLALLPWVLAVPTSIHAPGYCAMRGQCVTSAFANLPCVDNTRASAPSDGLRSQLVAMCGSQFATGDVCCDDAQWNDLVDQVKRAEPMIMSCPACWRNFLQFWCAFTCSGDQSTFVNITSVSEHAKGTAVEQTDFWVDDAFGAGFFDSCKDIKFGSSNGYAMDFIGGGADNWLDLVRYMGQKRPLLGSPIQIDFPYTPNNTRGMVPFADDPQSCSQGPNKCACVDCDAACPVLPPTPRDQPECHVGALRCWSFAMITTYAGILVLAAAWYVLHRPSDRVKRWIHRLAGQYDRVALTDDTELPENSDEEDELVDDDENPADTRLLDDPDHTPRHYWLNSHLQRFFYRQGLLCAQHPWIVIALSLIFVIACSFGWTRFAVEQDPIHLWVSPSSPELANKHHFDTHFAPFYRTTQLFIVSKDDDAPVLSADTLQQLFDLQDEIKTMRSDAHALQLKDVCFHPNGDACIVQSVTGYWQDASMFDPNTWRDDLDMCVSQPSLCLPDFQLPLKPQMVLGGYNGTDYLNAKALVVTYVLRNSLDVDQIAKSQDWENTLLRTILEPLATRPEWQHVRISFSTETSLEQELNKSSNTDAMTVVISYVVMFLYASLALGKWASGRRWFVQSKFTLGICGILIVIFSVSTSVGLFSLTGRKTTLIIAEVIPFLVLAVGVDNIFILCHEFQRCQEHGDAIEQAAAKTLGKMGPSILLSSLSETIAFGLGALVTMPAVSSFAMVAAIAVFVDFLLQVTCFVSCMVLDAHRAQAGRVDCVPCVRVRDVPMDNKDGWFELIWQQGFVPVVLYPRTRVAVCLGFLGVWMANLALVPQLPLGLDQRIALPSDSYLVPYFNDMDRYFNVGPPVYFVANGNLTAHNEQRDVCGRLPGCKSTSLANVLEQERKRPNVSYIGEPTSVWLDDFLQWLNPSVGCCRRKKNKEPLTLCGPWDDDSQCEPCYPQLDISNMDSLPQGQAFLDLFSIWIKMAPDEDCPLAGKAAYGDAIVVDAKDTAISTSHFRTFHTPLRTQDDFIQAYASAHRIATQLTDALRMDVYPYSVFYVFFEQYAQIVSMAYQLLGTAIISIFVVTSVLLGSLRCGAIVMVVVGMILTNVIGTMVLWDISLNAVSLVNLVICVGISVEFCCHIARAFMVANGSLLARARSSLAHVGSSVFSGITLTKFAGIIVLAFTRSKIFEVYYFRMYLAIVIYGALHGLILLPILLSLVGGKGMSILAEFDQEGIAWIHQALLTDDRDSFDQVLITDMPSSVRDR